MAILDIGLRRETRETREDGAVLHGGVMALAMTVTRDDVAQRRLRAALGQYATGVAVVTTLAPDGGPVGLTVNSFSSLSADPPLVLWCLRRDSASLSAFTTADHFAVNVLAAHQEWLARCFAAQNIDRFACVNWHRDSRGMPLLHGRLGSFSCRQIEQIRGGDHLIIVGHLEEYEVTAGQAPLVFFDGRYHPHLPGHQVRPPGHDGRSSLPAAAAAGTATDEEGRERQ
jgi:flavin reductase (DIM6/NTAB) family NADH-FMN oxidoreductase RutF